MLISHFFKVLTSSLLILLCLGLISCGKKTSHDAQKYTVITAVSKSTVTSLHFTGVLGPLTSQAVLSPLDGQVTSILFSYGQEIHKGQALITIAATKLAEDYRKTVSDFLEKKQTYETGLTSFEGTEALFKAGVVSAEEYSNAGSRQRSDTLAFYQAKYDLEKLLAQTGVSSQSVENLNLSDITQVNAILNRQFKEIKVYAPTDGVALFPTGDQKKASGSSGRVQTGDDLKAGQLILSIGDLTGLSMKLSISEISINLIKPNLAAKVTGNAFPGIELVGYVSSLASQANPQEGDSSNLAMFEVNIKIPKITPEQQRLIHVGMSATAELSIPEKPQIYLPIKAVYPKNGQKMVTVITQNNQQKEVPVITGKTTLTEVAIIQGISAGDRVAVPN